MAAFQDPTRFADEHRERFDSFLPYSFVYFARDSTFRRIASNLAACISSDPKTPVPWAYAPMFRSARLAPRRRRGSLALSAVLHAGFAAGLVFLPPISGTRLPDRAQADAQRMERTILWYGRKDLLPRIAPVEPKASRLTAKKRIPRAPKSGPETSTPRTTAQTIISKPPSADNRRQTIIQPEAPNLRIQSDVPIPNVVYWSRSVPPPPVELDTARQLAQIALPPLPKPKVLAREAEPPSLEALNWDRNVPVLGITVPPRPHAPMPEPLDANALKPKQVRVPALVMATPRKPAPPLPEPLELAAGNPRVSRMQTPSLAMPKISRPAAPMPEAPPLSASNRKTVELQAPQVALPKLRGAAPPMPEAPQLGTMPAAAPPTDSVRSLIAVSAVPAPPKDAISVPEGNRAGEFSVGLESGQRRERAPQPSGNGPSELASRDVGAIRVPGLSVSGGPDPGKSESAPAVPVIEQRPPAAASAINRDALAKVIASTARPSLLPEPRPQAGAFETEFFGAKRVYTVAINMPNLTSGSGSWVVHFAELNEEDVGEAADEISSPVAIKKVDPRYDPAAARERIEGTVTLSAHILRDGRVASVRVLRSLDERLDASAVAALMEWRFQPALKRGVPVDLEIVVQIPFHLPMW